MNPNRILLHGAYTALLLLTAGLPQLWAHSESFKPEFVSSLIGPYLKIQTGLASDQLPAAKTGAAAFLKAMDSGPKSGEAAEEAADLFAPAKKIAEAETIDDARTAFHDLSNDFSTLIRHIGTDGKTPLFLAHCPMAFDDKGADWVQADKKINNPYFGAKMLRCGSIKSELGGKGTHSEKK